MKTVKEVSNLTGISVRALHHYDAIGLLRPAKVSDAGYRLYDDKALNRLRTILLFRELRFPLKEIKEIIESPDFNQKKALEQQIKLLELQRNRLDELISFARRIMVKGANEMDFSAFDKTEIYRYEAEAKALWGKAKAYEEYERSTAMQTKSEKEEQGRMMMEIFAEMGKLKHLEPGCDRAQEMVEELQNFITDHYYTCTLQILEGLGRMYAEDERMEKNIDNAGGEGTARFASRAIEIYCHR